MRKRPRVIRDDKHGPVRPAAGSGTDGPIAAVIKWIPIEVIGAYQFASGLIPGKGADSLWLPVAFWAATPLWIGFAARDPDRGEPVAWRQLILSALAFLFWVFGTEQWLGNKLFPTWWAPWIGSAVLAIGVVALPVTEGILKAMGVPQGSNSSAG